MIIPLLFSASTSLDSAAISGSLVGAMDPTVVELELPKSRISFAQKLFQRQRFPDPVALPCAIGA